MNKVAFLIPTMNRADFVVRQLRYHASLPSPHAIYIGDSSNTLNQEKILACVRKFQNTLDITYEHLPGYTDRQAVYRLMSISKEKYCTALGDDDFIIPSAATKCADFLERNEEYRTAQGKAILFSLGESGPYGEIKASAIYWKKKEAEEDSNGRKTGYLEIGYL